MPRRDHLCSLLEALEPADAQELEHRSRMLQLLRTTQAPFSREQWLPGHVTASGFVVNRGRDALLLILHAKLGRWLQPGGHIEASDANVAEAAAREVREEVGLTDLVAHGVLDVDVHAIPAHGAQPAHEHFDVRFWFTAPDPRFTASSEVHGARWVPIATLLSPDAKLAHDESVLRAVRKLAKVS